LADGAFQAGLANSDWTWAVKLQDFALNGPVAAFFTNGVSRSFNNSADQRSASDYIRQTEWDYYESHPPRREENLAFANRGNLKFENVSTAWGLDHLGMSYAASTGDLDGDGDAELIVASLEEPVRIYRNNAAGSTRRVAIRLKGAEGNRQGLGANVWVQSGGRLQKRGLQPATGFLSSNQPVLQFGLGASEKIDHITVKWQRGHVQRFENLQAGRTYLIEEPSTAPPKWTRPARGPTLYAPVNSPSLRKIAHRETPYDDFTRQPLLPYKHSQLGPGMAWHDVDGDGDADCYLSGGAGQPGLLSLNEGKGTFRQASIPDLTGHAASEDLGAIFFDANSDGSNDLYVVSGGVECKPGSQLLRDRLYLNDGTGRFAHAPAALPDLRDSGSCVVGADYDRDGDLDLFVGGRVIPGTYPETPASRLLRNDSTPGSARFTDQTASVKGLQQAGLVSGALWSDANGDGWIDLLVCCEWGPVKVFLNNEGKLVEATAESGLATHLGWWKGIAGSDLDGDGDLDYVVTNQGNNTPYQATQEKPELLYYGDFDGSGKKRIVEAKFEGQTCYPRRGFSCSSGAIPVLRKRLKTFDNFARSTLGDLYGNSLSDSLRLEVNTLESCVLLNDGIARFTVRPLPRGAQFSPSQGVLLSDLDADGHVDCVLAQNFFGAQPEIGLLDSGLSLLLHGRGTGDFVASGPARSGIGVPGAATAITSADLNLDGRPELVFAVNSSPLMIFSEPPAREQTNRLLEVRLVGKPGNLPAVGSRITVRQEETRQSQTCE
ncbi:MAG: VCBS repeat-containing protein, partial [Roseibacillus sp.]|nr:VCBS repeat-containing protein [Roseibacillus sp.]